MIVGTTFEYLLTGTAKVGITKSGIVKVQYTDGVYEKRRAPAKMLRDMDADDASIVQLVAFVQDGRPAACTA